MSKYLPARRPVQSTVVAFTPNSKNDSLLGMSADEVRGACQQKIVANLDGKLQPTGEHFLNGVIARLALFYTDADGVEQVRPFKEMHCNFVNRESSTGTKLAEYLTNYFIDNLAMDDQVEYRYKLIDSKTKQVIATDMPERPASSVADDLDLPDFMRPNAKELKSVYVPDERICAWLHVYAVVASTNEVKKIAERNIEAVHAPWVAQVRRNANQADKLIAAVVVPQAKLEAWADSQVHAQATA